VSFSDPLPKSRAVREIASEAALANYPSPEAVQTKPLRHEVPGPSNANAIERPPGVITPPPPRTPSPEMPQTPKRAPTSVPRPQAIPGSSPGAFEPNTVPRRTNRIRRDYSPGPSLDPGPSSSLPTRPRQLSRPSLIPTRLRVPSGPSSPSTAILNRYQASPEFVSPTGSPPPSPTRDRSLRRSRNDEDIQMAESSPREPIIHTTTDLPATRKVAQRRDPYSHLSTLQRDIMLTIQNTLATSAEPERGVSIVVLVQTISRRRSGISQTEFK
jgi:hypothetical protein